MRSAVYEGVVTHRRHSPVPHRFSYRVALPLLDLDEVAEVCALHPLWSAERANVVSFRRRDFLDGGDGPLAEAVRDRVAAVLGRRPAGPVALLAHLRTAGWLFNPVSFYFCFDRPGGEVAALVADVTNTPWHERHAYVVGAPGRHRFDKALHVSPFFAMDQSYVLHYDPPGERLVVRFGNEEGGRRVFDATLVLHRRPLDRAALGRVVTRYPLMTARVSAGIYRQALALRRAGAPVHPHPRRRAPGGAQPAAATCSTACTTAAASGPVHPSAPSARAAGGPATAGPPTRTGTDDTARTARTASARSPSCPGPVAPMTTATGR